MHSPAEMKKNIKYWKRAGLGLAAVYIQPYLAKSNSSLDVSQNIVFGVVMRC